jgi:hypothetical protein
MRAVHPAGLAEQCRKANMGMQYELQLRAGWPVCDDVWD